MAARIGFQPRIRTRIRIPVSTWVGTNDTPAAGAWSPANNTAPSNMVQVTSTAYDNGGVGDGDVTSTTQYPGGGAAARTTLSLYDWRDRQVSTKSGATAALPAGFSDADIGSPAKAGSASFDGATWTVTGGGADVYGTSDQFHFASQGLAGDGSIVARVVSQSNTNASAKAGAMFRNDATANSAFADVVATPAAAYTAGPTLHS